SKAIMTVETTSAPLIYRTVRQASTPAVALAGGATGSNGQVVRRTDGLPDRTWSDADVLALSASPSPPGFDGIQTWTAPRPAIERQLDSAPAPATAPEAAAPETPAAAAPGEAGATSGAALDKLAHEVYGRLRRRLLVERERAGLGMAFP